MIERLMFLKKTNPATLFLFFLPIMVVIGPLVLLNTGCQPNPGSIAGSVKLLYTSEVGGRLDPCG